MKKVLVIDAQGGGLGRQIVAAIKESADGVYLTAVGTNSTATAAMLKAGADAVATGENSVIVCSRDADYIVGPIGIVIADSMLGEITPGIAMAVGQSKAKKLLIPMNQCNNLIVGYEKTPMSKMIRDVIHIISQDSECQNKY